MINNHSITNTNGISNKFILNTDPIPDGWRLDKIKKLIPFFTE